MATDPGARFRRVGETDRPSIHFEVDGEPVTALAGDSLMVAILSNRPALRRSEFGPHKRAGFCMMAACQDCWVWTRDGERLRACDTPVRAGLSILTEQPDITWPIRA